MTASSGVVLSNLAYLVGAVVLAIIGGLVVWLHHRQPKSVDANVESFHRGLRALAPDPPGPGSLRGSAGTGSAGPRTQPMSADRRSEGAGRPEALGPEVVGRDERAEGSGAGTG